MKNALSLAAMVAALLLPGAAARAEVVSRFDEPLKIETLDLPVDPSNPSAQPRITCRRFAGFMVKDIDLGEVGAEKLALLPPQAPCQRNTADEAIITDEAAGYFLGVAGSHVFFRAADGWNGGLAFVVFDADTKVRQFGDVFAGDGPALVTADGAHLVLEFEKVLTTSCSLRSDTDDCRHAIARETGLSLSDIPTCKAVYDAEIERTPEYAEDIADLPAVLQYPVRLTWENGAATVSPLAGKASCHLPS